MLYSSISNSLQFDWLHLQLRRFSTLIPIKHQ